MDYFYVLAGLGLLAVGGETLVRGAVALAWRLGLSPLIIGLTVIAYGTSAPELVLSLEANLTGSPGLALGNIVGSNIANILLIVGGAAVLRRVPAETDSLHFNGAVLLAASAVLTLLGLTGEIGPWAGALLLLALVLVTLTSYRRERATGYVRAPAPPTADGSEPALVRSLVLAVGGLLVLALGSDFMIRGAVGLARGFGISEETIGLTLVAFGTSLPEFATAAVAALRRHADLVLGNVLGSNLFNSLGTLGLVPLAGTIPVAREVALFDLPLMLGVTLVFVLWARVRGGFGRPVGAAFLVLYGLFIAGHALGVVGPLAPPESVP